jgi:ankyrin repeat protein
MAEVSKSLLCRSEETNEQLSRASQDDAGLVLLCLNWPRFTHTFYLTGRDGEARTALHHAACYGHCGVIKALLENEADINATDFSGRTARQLACEKGQMDGRPYILHWT